MLSKSNRVLFTELAKSFLFFCNKHCTSYDAFTFKITLSNFLPLFALILPLVLKLINSDLTLFSSIQEFSTIPLTFLHSNTFNKFKSITLDKKLRSSTPFYKKIDLIKEYYYYTYVYNLYNVTSYEANIIQIFGMLFEYDTKNHRYKLLDHEYDLIDFICISNYLFRYMASVNKKGFYARYLYVPNFLR